MRLHTLIAHAYLKLRKYRLARIYVERVYGPLHSYDDRVNKKKFPLDFTPDEYHNPAAYAELLYVAAKISLAHGNGVETWGELHEAGNLDPTNLKVLELYKETRADVEERRARKYARESEERRRKDEWVAGKSFLSSIAAPPPSIWVKADFNPPSQQPSKPPATAKQRATNSMVAITLRWL